MRLLLLLLFFTLSGCGPELMFGGVAGAGATLSKEKTVGSSVDDYTIWTKIKAAFLQHHKEIKDLLSNISVEVSEGRVLLTGKAASADDRLAILKLVWEQNGVREVINEIKLEGEQSGKSSYAKDAWITTQVKAKLLGNKLIKSINYNVETIDTVVYILGIARNDEELAQVITDTESVKNVSKVVNYIRVKTDHVVTSKEEEPSNEHDIIPPKNDVKSESTSVNKDATTSVESKPNTSSSSEADTDHEVEIGYDDA